MTTNMLKPSENMAHQELGVGVIIETPAPGYVPGIFDDDLMRKPVKRIQPEPSHTHRVLQSVKGSAAQKLNVRLAYEAHRLAALESASALNSAPVDLLPHQINLVQRIAAASPRRFLVADDHGLGNITETALIFKELAKQGLANRVLVIVPTGMMKQWQFEFNEVFKLGFETYSDESEDSGQVAKAFAKHNKIIASIDALTGTERVEKILQAPPWDVIIFDEAHHLIAYWYAENLIMNSNYSLAAELTDHTRDMILLSAAAHQGNNFQFWKLIQLLNPQLFSSPEEMEANRHQLNEVVIRRTRADAVRSNGEPLFASRREHLSTLYMTDEEDEKEEKDFYIKLKTYLCDGFVAARHEGTKGKPLEYAMAILQKFAASSFHAVRIALIQRLLFLTLHEAQLQNDENDIDGRDRLFAEAKRLLQKKLELAGEKCDTLELKRKFSEATSQLTRMLNEASSATSLESTDRIYETEFEKVIGVSPTENIPLERNQIKELLDCFPKSKETKIQYLLESLDSIWSDNPNEKIVIFTSYLTTAKLIDSEVIKEYPKQRISILHSDDYGAKVAASRKFRLDDGLRVLICSCTNMEGISFQGIKTFFNFDIPWDPMNLEQRIERIHGNDEVQEVKIYNLILANTVEGLVFLMLDEHLKQLKENWDFVSNFDKDTTVQIPRFLSENMDFEQTFQEALFDPKCSETYYDLGTAQLNAEEGIEAVADLFQDLHKFRLDEFKPISDVTNSMNQLIDFLRVALNSNSKQLIRLDDDSIEIKFPTKKAAKKFTFNREIACSSNGIELLGLDHPIVTAELAHWTNLPPTAIGVAVARNASITTMLSFWQITIAKKCGTRETMVLPLAVDIDGNRVKSMEKQLAEIFDAKPVKSKLPDHQRITLFDKFVEPMLQRESKRKKRIGDGSLTTEPKLIGYIEVS